MNSPFDEAKYQTLLKGLEIIELSKSEVKNENRTFRIDSSFFTKEALRIDEFLKSKPHFFLSEKEIVSGPFGSTLKSHSYLSEGVPFVRIENIKGGFEISKDQIIYISTEDNDRLKNSQLKIDDLVLSKVGNSIGYYARVDEELGECNISENNIGIKLQVYSKEQRHYILTFLNSSYGFKLTRRRISGNAQPKLNVFDVSEIPIPTFTDNFNRTISALILNARIRKLESKRKYGHANDLILKSLGLDDFRPSKASTNVKSFSSSFLEMGRIDAEFYQLKYEDIERKITKYSNGFSLISNEYEHIDEKSKVNKESYCYIEIGDINVDDGSVKGNILPTSELPANAKYEVKRGDLLISKVRPNRGAVTIIDFDASDVIVSGAFCVLRPKADSIFFNETLKVLLRTDIYKEWLLKFNVGTQYPVIKDEDILALPIPKVEPNIQEELTEKIIESQLLKLESERLLELAKRAVELAIEENEESGIEYIATQQT